MDEGCQIQIFCRLVVKVHNSITVINAYLYVLAAVPYDALTYDAQRKVTVLELILCICLKLSK